MVDLHTCCTIYDVLLYCYVSISAMNSINLSILYHYGHHWRTSHGMYPAISPLSAVYCPFFKLIAFICSSFMMFPNGHYGGHTWFVHSHRPLTGFRRIVKLTRADKVHFTAHYDRAINCSSYLFIKWSPLMDFSTDKPTLGEIYIRF